MRTSAQANALGSGLEKLGITNRLSSAHLDFEVSGICSFKIKYFLLTSNEEGGKECDIGIKLGGD